MGCPEGRGRSDPKNLVLRKISQRVIKPYDFIGFGAMDVTKPYAFIGFGAMAVTKPYRFIGFENFSMDRVGAARGPPDIRVTRQPASAELRHSSKMCQVFCILFVF